MKFESVEIENWGPFVGSRKINLSSSNSSPIVLIYGENGKGKTSFAKAIEWCLYGDLVDGPEGGFNPANYANWTATRDAKPFRVSVKLSFTVMDQVENENRAEEAPISRVRHFELFRSFEAHPTNPEKLKISVGDKKVQLRIDGDNPERESLIQPLINVYLPFPMAKFFLFDGEQFGRLKDELEQGTYGQVKKNIQEVMGLPALDFLQGIMEAKFKEQEKKAKQQKKNSEVAGQLDVVEEKIKRLKLEKVSALDEQVLVRAREAEAFKELEKEKGKEQLAADIRRLETERLRDSDLIAMTQEQIKEEMRNSWWVPLTDAITKSQEREKADRVKAQVQKSEIILIDLLRKSLESDECSLCEQTIHNHDALRKRLSEIESTSESDLETREKFSFVDAFLEPSVTQINLRHLLTDEARAKNGLRKIEGQIAATKAQFGDGDIVTIQGHAQAYRAAVARLGELTEIVARHDREITSQEGIQNDLRKKMVVAGGLGHAVEVRLEVVRQMIAVLASVKLQFVDLVRNEVATRASLHYVEMMNNPDLTGITIDEDFQIRAVHKNIGVKPFSSYGQSLVYVYAFIGALIDVSDNDTSWLIDTVGARLDSERMASVWKWLSNRNRQVVAMPHSNELRKGDAKALLGGSIAREYEIVSVDGNTDSYSEIRELGV